MPEGRPLRVLVAGGGTGGHLYPGIAIADEIRTASGGEAVFVGTARGLETRLVPAAGFPLELVTVSGLKRMVLRVGGYASGPLVFTAALLGYPTAIQEQNSLPGFTNRVLGRLVKRVFVAFE